MMKSAIANYEKALDAKKVISLNNYKVQVRSADITEIVRVCRGHNSSSSEYWKDNADSKVSRLKSQFSNYKDFKSYNAYRSSSGSGWFEDYRVYESWSHVNNSSCCSNYKEERNIIPGTSSWQITAESHRQYNAAIELANKKIGDLEKEARGQIRLKEQSNCDLKEAISLLENYNEDGGARKLRLETLQNNQGQVYRDLLSSSIEINKILLDEIKNLSLQERSHLLFNGLKNPDLKTDLMENYILRMGFDADYLAYIAFEQDNIDLFNYALKYGANPIKYSKDDKTLLQQIIQANNDQYIDLIIKDKSVHDLGTTILSAIKENDLLTIDRLISYKSDLFLDKLLGINLIEFVIYTKNEDLFDKILSLHPEIFELIDSKIIFNRALKYSADNIVLKILEYSSLSIKDYVDSLISTDERDLFENLNRICDANNIAFPNHETIHSEGGHHPSSVLIKSNLDINYSNYYKTDFLTDEDFI